jgi:hypothetical protein
MFDMRGMIAVFTLAAVGCGPANVREGAPQADVVKSDRFVKFTSHLGSSFTAPSQWTMSEEGTTFSLKSPDGHAVISAMVFTAEGSGTLEEFRELTASSLLPKNATGWKDSPWSKIKLRDADAWKRELVPAPPGDEEWRVYLLHTGVYYHAVVLHATSVVMPLNGDFYEDIVRSFEGIREERK